VWFRALSDDAEEEAVVLRMDKKQSEVHGSQGVSNDCLSAILHFAASFDISNRKVLRNELFFQQSNAIFEKVQEVRL
jgi:hypothetical protein